jgi:hypothetical protein
MEAGGGGGSCAGVVAVAAVSAAVTLATVRLFHGLESDFRRKIQLQRRTCSPRNLNLQLALYDLYMDVFGRLIQVATSPVA